MTAMRALEFDAELPVTPQRAFAAITEGRYLERWFCDACESEAEEDGRLTMRWRRPGASPMPYEATWVVFVPHTHCACRGGHEGYPNRDAGLIAFSIEPLEQGVLLRVRHEMPATSDYDAFAETYRDAWPRALSKLAKYLQPPPRVTT